MQADFWNIFFFGLLPRTLANDFEPLFSKTKRKGLVNVNTTEMNCFRIKKENEQKHSEQVYQWRRARTNTK